MNLSSAASSKSSSQIEVMQSLFQEILQIQKENKQPDESMKRIQEIIQESSRIVENSKSPNEIMVDAKILHTGTNYVSSNVSSFNTNLTTFSEPKYISGLLSYIENSFGVAREGKEWQCVSHITYRMFKKTHPVTYMLGTFTLEPAFVKERPKVERKQVKRVSENEKKILSNLTERETQAEPGSDIYDHILKCLVREYKKNNRKPINCFSFIIDPTDYWRTIENIFHFAFLVRDGNVKMSIENNLPHVEPILRKPEESIGRKPCDNQFCFRLSVQEWKECVERLEVPSPSIPPFVKRN